MHHTWSGTQGVYFTMEKVLMKAELIDFMGSDLTVVNAARVSFAKKHDEFDGEKDEKLIRYLAEHDHWSPFAHPQLQIHMKAPIFLARQLDKHQIGLTKNEVSRRYVSDDPEFFRVVVWKNRPDNVKQGADGVLEMADQMLADEYFELAMSDAKHTYEKLLEIGVAPEQARSVLPMAMYTEWYWTGSLFAFTRVVRQRSHSGAQGDLAPIIQDIRNILVEKFPISTKYLLGE